MADYKSKRERRYGVYLGHYDHWEVWEEGEEGASVQDVRISVHDTSDAAHEARRRYQAADKRRATNAD
jgi:hypothetical protein